MICPWRSHANWKKKATISALFFAFALLTGCNPESIKSIKDYSDRNSESRRNERVRQGAKIPEEKFLIDEDVISQLNTGCKNQPVKEERNDYGVLVRYSGCKITINAEYPPLQEIYVTKTHDLKKVIGYSAAIYGDGQYRKHLKVILGESRILQLAHSCAKFGEISLPILQVVKSDYCEALQYNLI